MRKGFTLIELLVVIAIIGLISVFVLDFNVCEEGNDCKASSVVKNLTSEYDYCMKLDNLTQKDLPVKCLRYYTR